MYIKDLKAILFLCLTGISVCLSGHSCEVPASLDQNFQEKLTHIERIHLDKKFIENLKREYTALKKDPDCPKNFRIKANQLLSKYKKIFLLQESRKSCETAIQTPIEKSSVTNFFGRTAKKCKQKAQNILSTQDQDYRKVLLDPEGNHLHGATELIFQYEECFKKAFGSNKDDRLGGECSNGATKKRYADLGHGIYARLKPTVQIVKFHDYPIKLENKKAVIETIDTPKNVHEEIYKHLKDRVELEEHFSPIIEEESPAHHEPMLKCVDPYTQRYFDQKMESFFFGSFMTRLQSIEHRLISDIHDKYNTLKNSVLKEDENGDCTEHFRSQAEEIFTKAQMKFITQKAEEFLAHKADHRELPRTEEALKALLKSDEDSFKRDFKIKDPESNIPTDPNSIKISDGIYGILEGQYQGKIVKFSITIPTLEEMKTLEETIREISFPLYWTEDQLKRIKSGLDTPPPSPQISASLKGIIKKMKIPSELDTTELTSDQNTELNNLIWSLFDPPLALTEANLQDLKEHSDDYSVTGILKKKIAAMSSPASLNPDRAANRDDDELRTLVISRFGSPISKFENLKEKLIENLKWRVMAERIFVEPSLDNYINCQKNKAIEAQFFEKIQEKQEIFPNPILFNKFLTELGGLRARLLRDECSYKNNHSNPNWYKGEVIALLKKYQMISHLLNARSMCKFAYNEPESVKRGKAILSAFGHKRKSTACKEKAGKIFESMERTYDLFLENPEETQVSDLLEKYKSCFITAFSSDSNCSKESAETHKRYYTLGHEIFVSNVAGRWRSVQFKYPTNQRHYLIENLNGPGILRHHLEQLHKTKNDWTFENIMQVLPTQPLEQ